MVYYKCETCGYTTGDKSRLNNHLNRKNPCFVGEDNYVSKVIKNQIPHKSLTKSLTKPSQTLTNPNTDNDCIYCGKTFKRKDNLKRHMESYCKIMKSQMTSLESEKSALISKTVALELKTTELEKKVEQLNQDLINKPQQINNTINNQTNTINTQNIKINNYGKENLDFLTVSGVNKLIDAPYTSIPNLIRSIHYNPEHPENNNMKITNKREPYIKVLDGDKWHMDNKKRVIEDLIDKGKLILDKFRDEELHSEFKNNCYDNFSHRLENSDKELIKQMIGDLELLIINNS